jgi:hypothetical protein
MAIGVVVDPKGSVMSAPAVELARWQRRYFQIRDEFFRRASESTRDAVEPRFGAWRRPNAIRLASTGPAVPFLCARLDVPASYDKSSGLRNGLRSDVMVWV